MSFPEYGLRFDSFARYAPVFVETIWASVHWFVAGLASDYIGACTTTALMMKRTSRGFVSLYKNRGFSTPTIYDQEGRQSIRKRIRPSDS